MGQADPEGGDQAEAPVAISQATLRALALQHTTAGIVVQAPDDAILMATPRACSLLGLSLDQLQGRSSMHPLWRAMSEDGSPLHPDEHPSRVAQRTGRPRLNFIMQVSRGDGGRIWLNVCAHPIAGGAADPPLGTVVTFTDVTREVLLRRTVRDEAQILVQYRALFDLTTEAVVITDPDARILEINPAFVRITGYSAREAIGQSTRLLNSGAQPPEFFTRMWRELGERGRWEGEIINRRADGSLYPQRLRIAAINDESGALTRYVAVFNDITQAKTSAERLDYMAHYDALTGAGNRLLLNSRLLDAIAGTRLGQRAALMVCDIDRFKQINDRHGYEIGDAVLVAVAQRLRAHLEPADTLVRLGADDFVVLFRALTGDVHLQQRVEAIRATLQQPLTLEAGLQVRLNSACGVAQCPHDGEDPHTLLRLASAAMFRAKAEAPGTVRFHEPALAAAAAARWRISEALIGAIGCGEIEAWYQPQVKLTDGSVAGFEALARWRHPTRGVLAGGAFVPIAVEAKLEVTLDRHILQSVLRDIAGWLARGVDVPRVAVNVTPSDLLDDAYLDLLHSAPERGVPHRYLMVELTETSVAPASPKFEAALARLDQDGIWVSIDDFGTGYSSMMRLKHIRARQLKLDRSFVADLPESKDDSAIASASLSLGKILGLETVAEGIETQQQADALRALGADVGQGWLYSRAIAAEAIPAWLTGRRVGAAPES